MKLNVFFGKEKCGLLSTTDNRGIVFQYLETYLLKPHSKSISLSLPLQQEEFSQKQCLPFFSGLLPEEFTRKRVADYLHISELSTMKLLEALGQECAGFITIADDEFDESNLKTKYEIDSSNYEKISYERLEEFVKNITLKPFIKADDKLRLSLAGAQEKLALAFFNNQSEQLNINQKVIFEILAKLKDKIAEFLKKENDISSVYKTASERLGDSQ